nr:MAG TPA: hypothetical protein [Caudoviricetes sp.]
MKSAHGSMGGLMVRMKVLLRCVIIFTFFTLTNMVTIIFMLNYH